MVGTLSQIVALSSAVNGYLAGAFDVERFFPDHAEFRFCRSVAFVGVARDWLGRQKGEVDLADDPNRWLAALQADGARRALLKYEPSPVSDTPDHMLVGFVGGGGTWSLLVEYPDRIDRWVARWAGADDPRADNRNWIVTYGLIESAPLPPPASYQLARIDLRDVASRFQRILGEAERFARGESLDGFADAFRGAGGMLTRARPITFPDYVDFVCLDRYPQLAQRLFAAAYAAFVFGGMGSWNDMAFKDPDTTRLHDDLSRRLYAAINEAIEQSAASFIFSGDAPQER